MADSGSEVKREYWHDGHARAVQAPVVTPSTNNESGIWPVTRAAIPVQVGISRLVLGVFLGNLLTAAVVWFFYALATMH